MLSLDTKFHLVMISATNFWYRSLSFRRSAMLRRPILDAFRGLEITERSSMISNQQEKQRGTMRGHWICRRMGYF